MNSLVKKTAAGIAAGALLLATAVPSAFASSTGVGVSGNGAFSSNDVNVNNSCTTDLSQSNSSNIVNDIRNYASTGGNGASFNTGGSVTIVAGSATSNVDVANAAGSNMLSGVGGCGTGYSGVGINGNGAFSDTSVDVNNWSREDVRQYNETAFLNSVYNNLQTGENYSAFNTGTDVMIFTGGAHSTTDLSSQAGSNVLH